MCLNACVRNGIQAEWGLMIRRGSDFLPEFPTCLCQDFTSTAVPAHILVGHVSCYTLCPIFSNTIFLCLLFSVPHFSLLPNVYLLASLPTYLSLSFNCLAQYLFLFMQAASLTWETIFQHYGYGRCLLGHPKVESVYHEYIMYIVSGLTELFNASLQQGWLRVIISLTHSLRLSSMPPVFFFFFA